MNYSVKEYKEKFFPSLSIRTVQRRIREGNISSYHVIKMVGRNVCIEVEDVSHKEMSYRIKLACDAVWKVYEQTSKYHNSAKPPIELVVSMAEKYGLSSKFLIRILGGK